MEKIQELQKAQVIYVTSPERAINYKWEKDSKKINSQVRIISEDDLSNLQESGYIHFPQKPIIGDVLVKHPFEPCTYIHAENAIETIRQSKFFKICEIAQLLGTVKYQTDAIWKKSETRKVEANGEINYEVVVDSEIKIDSKEKMAQVSKLTINADFNGIQVISKESFLKAQNKAKEYGLWGDVSIISLINQRDPENQNRLKELKYHIDLTSEANHLLDIAFSLEVAAIFNLKATIKSAISKQENMTIDVTFVFPDE